MIRFVLLLTVILLCFNYTWNVNSFIQSTDALLCELHYKKLFQFTNTLLKYFEQKFETPITLTMPTIRITIYLFFCLSQINKIYKQTHNTHIFTTYFHYSQRTKLEYTYITGKMYLLVVLLQIYFIIISHIPLYNTSLVFVLFSEFLITSQSSHSHLFYTFNYLLNADHMNNPALNQLLRYPIAFLVKISCVIKRNHRS